MVAIYSEVDPSIVALVEELVEQYHPMLKSCLIGLVFRSEAVSVRGRTILASTSKVPGKVIPLLAQSVEMMIVIAEDLWAGLSASQRRALIDHELCHITLGDNGWTLKGHDIEEFHEIIERYGFWNNDLLGLQSSIPHYEQLMMDIAKKGGVVAVRASEMADLEDNRDGS